MIKYADPLLYKGIILCTRHELGQQPSCKMRRKSFAGGSTILRAMPFKSLAGSKSGPVAVASPATASPVPRLPWLSALLLGLLFAFGGGGCGQPMLWRAGSQEEGGALPAAVQARAHAPLVWRSQPLPAAHREVGRPKRWLHHAPDCLDRDLQLAAVRGDEPDLGEPLHDAQSVCPFVSGQVVKDQHRLAVTSHWQIRLSEFTP